MRYDYLDGWRGLAIIFLLIGHILPVPGINFGIVGVHLFFVLSGLLMAKLLFIDKTPIPIFYRRRLSRIFPAHFLFLFCIIIYFLAMGKGVNWHESAAAATFLTNYFPGELGNAVMPFGHIWSLSVEEHSYILLSFVAILSRRGWANPLWVTGILSVIFSLFGFWYSSRHSGKELIGLLVHTEVAASGIFISTFLMLLFKRIGIPRMPVMIYPLLLGLGISVHWWSIPKSIGSTIGVGIFALIVNLLADAPVVVKQVLSLKLFRVMGLWSFSIYLWQQPFYLSVHREGFPKWEALLLAICAGILSFYLVERPVRQYLNRMWGRRIPQAD